MSLLSTSGLTIQYDGNVALSNVDFEISRGEIVTIVGPNGSGKSTFLRAVIGAITPSKGMVKKLDGLKIGYVPQKLQIDPTLPLSVERFMALPVPRQKHEIVSALKNAGVGEFGKRQLSSLSGGQFQRVLLARALLSEPDILILDEATQGLDQQGAAAFYRHIEKVRQTLGCAVLMVSHELHVVMSASDRVVCLNGHVCCHGTPELVASAPEYRALFGEGTGGALALYRHQHNHSHDDQCGHDHGGSDHV